LFAEDCVIYRPIHTEKDYQLPRYGWWSTFSRVSPFIL
jgi:hypothetical protein